MQQSVASLFELYLSRSDLRPASVRFKRQALKYFVEWFEDLPVGKVTPAHAEDYRTLLAKGRSRSAANGYLANFRPFWQWLRRHGRIDQNPFEGVRAYKLTEQPRATFSPSELSRLMTVSDDFWRIRICLGLLGMRRGEMLATVVSDIHMDDTPPHILLSEKQATATMYQWGIKSHAVRWVAFPPVMQFDGITVELHRLVRERIAGLPANQPYPFLEDAYARKCAGKEEVYDPTGNFQRMFRSLQRRAQIEPMKRYHELRAAFATAMIDQQGLSRAADALGHASTQTTRRYDRKSQLSLVAEMSLMAQKCYTSRVP